MSPALIQALIMAGIQYGPSIITDIKNLFNKKDATIEDIEAVFANLKPYSAFNIPDIAPTSPVVTIAPNTSITVPQQ